MRSVCNSSAIACQLFCVGPTLGFFHSDVNSAFIVPDLKIIFKGLHNDLPQILIIQIPILSGPCALFGFKFWIIPKISSWKKLMDVSDWSVWGAKLVGSLLLFCNIEHCSEKKKELKSSAFWRKVVIKLPLWYGRVMTEIFLSFTELLKWNNRL